MTVVIGGDDDDLPDALDEIPPPLDVTDPASRRPNLGQAPRRIPMEPKIRRRRIEIGRSIGRKRLVALIAGGTVVLVGLGALLLFTSPLFSVEQVTVYGDVYTEPAELQTVIDDLEGQPTLAVDIQRARAALEALPYIREARVRADFPHTVSIELEERVPAAAFAGEDGLWRIIDVEGRVLVVIDGAPADYPAIRNAGQNLAPGEAASGEFASVAQLATAVPEELGVWISSFDVTTTGEVTMNLRSGTTVQFGQPLDRSQSKLAVILTTLRELPPAKVARLDVTNPEAPVVTKK
jgi:cell division protein FtsQ